MNTAETTDPTSGLVTSVPIPANYRGEPYPVNVQALRLPAGSRRVWRKEKSGGVIVRDLGGFGPKGSIPIGYVAEGVVISEPGVGMSDLEIHFVASFFACHPNATPPVPETGGRTHIGAPFGRCLLCAEPHGLPHAADCRHFGKDVGDKVR